MMRENHQTNASAIAKYFLSILLVVSGIYSAHAEDDPKAGMQLFISKCARCHYTSGQDMTGPGLLNVQSRWESEALLIKWVQNNQAVLRSGNEYANNLWKEFNKLAMPVFPNLSEQDVKNILAYIANPSAFDEKKPAGGDNPIVPDPKDKKGDNTTLYIFILLGVAVLLIVLARSLNGVSRALANVSRQQAGKEPLPEPEPFAPWANFKKWVGGHKKITAVIGVIIMCISSYWSFEVLMGIGVYEGYQPEQPIKFSHKLHVVQNQIQCQYCHHTVTDSRHANVPSANICMNCHKAVNTGPTYGRTEIAKIYASIGWNPIEMKYFDNYLEQPVEEIKEVFEEWLKDSAGAIVEVSPFIQKPIRWIQVHKLPDLAFFSHEQHVAVGKIECVQCHGDMTEITGAKIMPVKKLNSYQGNIQIGLNRPTLTMGWCINCHKETEVQWASNDYYNRLHDYYKKHYGEYNMEKGEAFTVAKIGGLECGKCHY